MENKPDMPLDKIEKYDNPKLIARELSAKAALIDARNKGGQLKEITDDMRKMSFRLNRWVDTRAPAERDGVDVEKLYSKICKVVKQPSGELMRPEEVRGAGIGVRFTLEYLAAQGYLQPQSRVGEEVERVDYRCDQCHKTPREYFDADPQSVKPFSWKPEQCPMHWYPSDGCDGTLQPQSGDDAKAEALKIFDNANVREHHAMETATQKEHYEIDLKMSGGEYRKFRAALSAPVKPDGPTEQNLSVFAEKQFDGKTFKLVGFVYGSLEDIGITVLDMSYPCSTLGQAVRVEKIEGLETALKDAYDARQRTPNNCFSYPFEDLYQAAKLYAALEKGV